MPSSRGRTSNSRSRRARSSLRQGAAARERRPLGARDRAQHRDGRALSLRPLALRSAGQLCHAGVGRYRPDVAARPGIRRPGRLRRSMADDMARRLLLSLLRVAIASAFMVIAARNPGPFGAVPHPGLRQRRRAVRADGRRVPGDDPGRRLCRRGGGAVPVRRHDAGRRFRRAARRASCNICRSAR